MEELEDPDDWYYFKWELCECPNTGFMYFRYRSVTLERICIATGPHAGFYHAYLKKPQWKREPHDNGVWKEKNTSVYLSHDRKLEALPEDLLEYVGYNAEKDF